MIVLIASSSYIVIYFKPKNWRIGHTMQMLVHACDELGQFKFRMQMMSHTSSPRIFISQMYIRNNTVWSINYPSIGKGMYRLSLRSIARLSFSIIITIQLNFHILLHTHKENRLCWARSHSSQRLRCFGNTIETYQTYLCNVKLMATA